MPESFPVKVIAYGSHAVQAMGAWQKRRGRGLLNEATSSTLVRG